MKTFIPVLNEKKVKKKLLNKLKPKPVSLRRELDIRIGIKKKKTLLDA